MKVIPNLSTVFAGFLLECRNKHDYSKRKLAARIGCSRSHIAFLEDGTHLPTINTVMLLAEAFQMAPAVFQAELDARLQAFNMETSHEPPYPSMDFQAGNVRVTSARAGKKNAEETLAQRVIPSCDQ